MKVEFLLVVIIGILLAAFFPRTTATIALCIGLFVLARMHGVV